MRLDGSEVGQHKFLLLRRQTESWQTLDQYEIASPIDGRDECSRLDEVHKHANNIIEGNNRSKSAFGLVS